MSSFRVFVVDNSSRSVDTIQSSIHLFGVYRRTFTSLKRGVLVMELLHLGLNQVTLGLLLVFVVTIIQAKGLLVQRQRVLDAQSTLSMSTVLYIWFVYAFAYYILFGLQVRKIALVFHGCVMAIASYGVVRALVEVDPLRGYQVVIGTVLAWFTIASSLTTYVRFIFETNAYLSIAVIAVLEPGQILWNRKRGVIDIFRVFTFWLSAVLFLVYAYAIHDQSVIRVTRGFAFLHAVTMGIWFLFPNKNNVEVSE